MKQIVKELNKKETDEERREIKEAAAAASKASHSQIDFEIEDQFKLPYGVGYDHVIKKKTDMINS